MRARLVAAVAVAVLGASPEAVHAMFLASDLIYVPIAAYTEGSDESFWQTDVTITNVESEDAVDVAIYFLPSGAGDNSTILDSRESGLGGRESEGWGHVDPVLADIPAGGTVVLANIVGEHWSEEFGERAANGGLVVFAYRAGTLDQEGELQYRNVVVQSRSYNLTTIWVPDTANQGQFVEQEATFGQTVPGIPWYALADAGFAELSFQILTDGRQDDDWRYNLGVFNTSDPQTSLVIRVEPFGPDGVQLKNADDSPMIFQFNLAPLQHQQYNSILIERFGISGVQNIRFKVSIVAWSSLGPDPVPTFVAYGSLLDRRTSDGTTILPSFSEPFDVDCVWSSRDPDAGASAAAARLAAEPRPLEIPDQWAH